ncbi:MAG: DUF697 domain-containing protein [Elainellaceae cyanobacterium]
MAMKLKRPVLVGGIGLTCGAWIWGEMAPSVGDIAGTSLWGAIAIGSGLWLLKRRSPESPILKPLPSIKPVTTEQVEQVLSKAKALIAQFATEAEAAQKDSEQSAATVEPLVEQLQSQIEQIRDRIIRPDLHLTIMGDRRVGKSALYQWLQANRTEANQAESPENFWSGVTLTDTTSQLDSATSDRPDQAIAEALGTSDLVLAVTAGDLTDSAFRRIQELVQQRHRVLLVLNQHDRYLPDERTQLMQHLRQRLDGLVQPQDVVSVAIAPAPIKVRQHHEDGSVQERMEDVPPDAAALMQSLKTLLTQDRQQLCMMASLRQAHELTHQIQQQINAVRRDRALPVIEEYQWISAAAAFANPVPTLDLMAIAAINTQLIIDLGQFYHLQVSTAQAKAIAGTLAEVMVKLGLVELASQALSPLLKSNVMTFAAGGFIQGISAAYLTRIAGLSLIEFLEQQALEEGEPSPSHFSLDAFAPYLQAVFQRNQRTEFLKSLIQQGTAKLLPAHSR